MPRLDRPQIGRGRLALHNHRTWLYTPDNATIWRMPLQRIIAKVLGRSALPRIGIAVAGMAALSGCEMPSNASDRLDQADSAILRAQVSLMQATEQARANVEARAAEQAAASVDAARAGSSRNEEVPITEDERPIGLGDRYAVRRDGNGWAVYDAATGRTVRNEGLPATGLLQEEARLTAESLNRSEANRPVGLTYDR